MKILLNIIITFILFISFLTGLLFVVVNIDNVSEMEGMTGEIQLLQAVEGITGSHDTYGDIPTAADYQKAVYVDIFFTLACIAGIVFTFINRKTPGLVAAGFLGLMAILFFVFQPRLNGSAFEGDSQDSTFALVVCIFTFVAAGLIALLKLKFSNPPAQAPVANNVSPQ